MELIDRVGRLLIKVERWVTIHPSGKGYTNAETGGKDYRRIKIDGHGNIVGGSIPKDLQGQNIREAFRKNKKPQPHMSRHLTERGVEHHMIEAESGHTYQIGGGMQPSTDKWGRETARRGTVQFQKPQPKPKIGSGTWVHVYSNFDDKDALKSMGARFDSDTKGWYIPLKDVPNVAHRFRHATINSTVVDAYEQELSKNPEIPAKKEVAIQTKDGEIRFEAKHTPAWDGKMPAGMEHVNLYQHQKAGVEFLLQNKKAILGMAVGLGKTPSAITAANILLQDKKIDRFAVIAPSTVKYQWKSEIEKFSDKKAVVLDSSMSAKKLEQAFEDAKNADFVIANYEMLRNADYAAKLKDLAGDAVIADEGHKVKNYKSQQTKAFKETFRNAKYKWLLTATPFPNAQPMETYTMLGHATAKVGTWKDWSGKYAVLQSVNTPNGRVMKPVSLKNQDKLKEEMKDTVFLRTHTSADVNSSLPSARHVTHSMEMAKDQAKLYNAMKDDLMHQLEGMGDEEYKKNAVNVLAKMKRLEQIATDPDQLNSEKADMKKLYPKEQWAVDTIADHLEDKENRGIVVFSDAKLPLEKVKNGLIAEGLSSSQIGIISGDVSPEKRKTVQDAFSEGKVKVVLATSAAEEGVNLQTGGHTMIHMDTPWVPKSITQREGRILRTGQPSKHTLFYSPVMADTVEDQKRGKLAGKIADIEKLLGEGAAGSAAENVAATAQAWTLDDMKEILGATKAVSSKPVTVRSAQHDPGWKIPARNEQAVAKSFIQQGRLLVKKAG